MEELKIIDENHIIYDSVRYKAVKSGFFCDDCAFHVKNNCRLFCKLAKERALYKISCSHSGREDGKNVIWVVEDYTPETYEKAKPLL